MSLSFGLKVQGIMKQKNIKPVILAKKVNLSDRMLEGILKDYVKPKRFHLRRFATALQVSLQRLEQ